MQQNLKKPNTRRRLQQHSSSQSTSPKKRKRSQATTSPEKRTDPYYKISEAEAYEKEHGKSVGLYVGLSGELMVMDDFEQENEKLVIPWGVQDIPVQCFRNRNIFGEIVLPPTLKRIGSSAFARQSPQANFLYGDLIIPLQCEIIGAHAFRNCKSLSSLKFVNGSKLQRIGDCAFEKCIGLCNQLIFPHGIKYIGKAAFRKCKGFWGDLCIPQNVEYIDTEAFKGCKFDGELYLPKNLVSIGESAFEDNIYLKGFGNRVMNKLVEIKAKAFCNCMSLESAVVFPESLTYIGPNAFSNCPGICGTLKVPTNCTQIEDGAFRNCTRLEAIQFSDTCKLTYIGKSCFRGCKKLQKLVFPQQLRRIDAHAFRGCVSLQHVHFNDNLAVIESMAFKACKGLSGQVTLPPKLNIFRSDVFQDCKGLYLFKINDQHTIYERSDFDVDGYQQVI